MKVFFEPLKTAAVVATTLLFSTAIGVAAEIKVMSSAGFSEAYKALLPEFEKKTGHKVVNSWGPSMGETPQAIPNRIARGEPVDIVIMANDGIGNLIASGKVDAGSQTALAHAVIGGVVRAGAPKPDISTVEAFKKTLLAAKSISYSDSASGVYLSTVIFPKLGIADAIKDKAKKIPAEPVAQTVARGEYEIGFQTMSELLPIPGVDQLGPIPSELQKKVTFSAALSTTPEQKAAAQQLIAYLASPEAAGEIKKSGMLPGAAN